MKDSKIVAATGVAAGANRKMGPLIESAMAKSVTQVARDSEAIWARTDISEEEKNALIAAINTPEAIRERMHAARSSVKQNVGA